MKEEIWKPIPGYKIYEASSFGRIRSVDRYVETFHGRQRLVCGKLLSLRKDSTNRYVIVDLHNGKERKTRLVHRVIYEAFFGKIEVGLEINHKNGITDDNAIDNLELVTRSQNEKHKYSHLNYGGTFKGRSGSKHPRSKRVAMKDLKTGEIISVFDSNREAERITGTPSPCITLCCKGKQKSSNGYAWTYFNEQQ